VVEGVRDGVYGGGEESSFLQHMMVGGVDGIEGTELLLWLMKNGQL
jgi:hypothetical protein